MRIRELQTECFLSFRSLSLFLSHTPEHAGPEDRAREARPDGAADAQRLVRGAAREQQVAFPSAATGSSNGRLLVAVVFVLAAVASSCSCCCSPRLLLLPRRRRRSLDVSRRASRGGGGRVAAPGGRQQRLALRRRHLFSLGKKNTNAFSFVSLSRFFRFTHKLFLSLSLFPSPALRCIAINEKSTQGQVKINQNLKQGSCRRSGPPRPSPGTPCRSATRRAS